MEIPNFSDLVEDKSLSGDKVSLNDILGKRIIVTGYNVSNSKYAKKGVDHCVKVQFYYQEDKEEKRYIFFTGSSVIKSQLEEIEAQLKQSGNPFIFKATVNKIGNYYSFE